MTSTTRYPSVRYKILPLNRPGGSNGSSSRISFTRGVAPGYNIPPLQGFTVNPVLDDRSMNGR
ncbi:MAG TPA: hypothetical protein PLK12_00405 [Prolixibacteraceae bacterium]|nr:hypothetical protein [Prolixibacteraceae bacterium]